MIKICAFDVFGGEHMETKWYSDIWQLTVAPFKRGIPQIVEHGSCRKGFYATVAMALVSLVFSDILPALVSTIFADKLDGALAIVAALFGGGILNLMFGLLFAFICIAIYSAIFSWVANKFDANTTYESVLKIMWYEQAYNQIMGLVFCIAIILVSVPFLVVLGFNLNSTVNSIVWLTIVIFTLIAYSVFTFWVWLTLLSRQINKSRLSTFGISIITSLIPVVFIGILVGMVMLATSR